MTAWCTHSRFGRMRGSRTASTITAEDVRSSWERVADPETSSNGVSTYLGDIASMQARLDGEATEISGLTVIDDRTLQVTLDGPKPYFLAKLTYPVTFVTDPYDLAKGDRWMFEPNASGPSCARSKSRPMRSWCSSATRTTTRRRRPAISPTSSTRAARA